jgi:hypothetical protein
MEDMNQSVVCTQYIPFLCPISKSIPGWHLKSSIKVVYFVTTENIKSYIASYIRLNYSLFQSVSKSIHVPHCLCPLLKPSPPLLPVQFTQSSLQTAATPIVCSVYTESHLHSPSIYSSYFHVQSHRVLPELLHESTNNTRHSLQSPIARHSLLRRRHCCPPAPPKAELNGALYSNKDLLPIASVFPLSTAISVTTRLVVVIYVNESSGIDRGNT